MFDKLFKSADMLQSGLEASWLRNTVLRNNIANVETPDFKGSDVVFESVFAEALAGSGGFKTKTTREGHIDFSGGSDVTAVRARIVANEDLSMRMDGNNVDIDAENTKIAQNTILYNTMMYKLNSELTRIKLAVTEGK